MHQLRIASRVAVIARSSSSSSTSRSLSVKRWYNVCCVADDRERKPRAGELLSAQHHVT